MKDNKAHLLRGEKLKARAEQLGVSFQELWDNRGVMAEPELQRRVLEAERSLREFRLWIVAVVSAVASVVSALAAWAAVMLANKF